MTPRQAHPGPRLFLFLPVLALLLGALSLSLAAPPAGAQVPGAPANPRITVSDGKLDLRWTAPSGTVTGYDVHYTTSTIHFNAAVQTGVFTNPAYGWVDAGHTGTAASKTISNLNNGTTYRLRVRTVNSAGHSGWAFLTGVPRLVRPSTPSGLAVRVGNTKLTLTWRAPSETVASYDVHYTWAPVGTVANTGPLLGGANPNPGAGWVAVSRMGTAASQTISSLTNGRAYRVRVRAANGAGRSNWVFGRGTPAIVVVMGFTGHTEVGQEGRTETFVVRLSEALASATTVDIRVATSDTTCRLGANDGRATETDDFTLSTKRLSFSAGETQKTFTANLVADRTSEGPEIFCLALVAPQGAPYELNEDYALVEVLLEDLSLTPGLYIDAPEKIWEGGDSINRPVRVYIGGPAPAGGTAVTYTLGSGGSATETSDFTLSSKTVTIPAGKLVADVTLKAVDDAVDDDGETIVLQASSTNPSFTASPVTVTIVDNDPPTTVKPSNVAVTPGPGNLRVTWEGPTGAGTLDYSARVQWRKSSPRGGWVGYNRSVGSGYIIREPHVEAEVAYDVRVGFRPIGALDPVAEPEEFYSSGATVWSDPVTATPGLSPPSPPRNVRLTPGDRQFTLQVVPPASWGSWEPGGYLIIYYTTLGQHQQCFVCDDPDEKWVIVGTFDYPTTGRVFKPKLVNNIDVKFGNNGHEHRIRVAAWSKKPGTDGLQEGTYMYGRAGAEARVTPSVGAFSRTTTAIALSVNDDDKRVAEDAGALTLTATLNAPVTTATNVSLSVGAASTATEGDGGDFTLSPKTITIAAGEKSGTATLTVLDDEAPEPNEVIVIEATSGNMTPDSLNLTIVDNDEAIPAPTGLTVTPGDSKLDLSWTAPASGTVTGYDVAYKEQSAPDAAATDDDPSTGWVAVSRTETNPPTASQTISSLTNDTAYRVGVRANAAVGNSLWITGGGTPSALTSLPVPANFMVEAGDGEATASWDEVANANEYVLSYGVSGSGTAQEENVGSTTSHTLTDLVNGAEYLVSVQARDTTGSYGPGAWHAGIAVTPREVLAANTGLLSLTVSAAEDAAGPFAPIDLTGETPSFTATVPPAITHVKLTPVTDHAAATVTVNGSAVTSGTESPAIAVAVGATAITVRVTAEDSTMQEEYTVTIVRQSPPGVTLSVAPNPVAEGESVTVTATLSRAATRSVTIPVTVTAGTAEADDHGTLTGIRIPRGRTSGTGRIATRQDDDSDDETFTVALDTANLPSPLVAGATTSVTITIDDDDTPTVELWASPRHPVAAGDSVTVTARVSAALPGDLTIPLTVTAGTAEEDDYGTLSSITIAAGATSGTGTISTRQDSDTVSQSFKVGLDTANLPAEVQPGTRHWVRVTIAPASVPIVWLTVPDGYRVDEGGTATVTARLTQAFVPAAAVTIPLTARFVGGSPASHEVTIPAGATSGTHDIAVPHDDDANHETLIVEIDERMLPAVEPQVRVARYSSDYPTSVVITVMDIPTLETARSTAREGRDDAVAFTVRLSYPPYKPVSVSYTTAEAASAWQGAAPATAGADYTHVAGTVAFGPGERAKTVRVPLLDDAIDEGTEYFLLRFSDPVGAYLKTSETQGLITNDDPLQTAWLSRFGRTAATHVTDAVSDRLRGRAGQDSHLTVGGYRVPVRKPAAGVAPPEAEPPSAGAGQGGPASESAPAEASTATAVLTEVARVLGMGPGAGSAHADPWAAPPDPRLGPGRTLEVGQTFTLRRLLLGSAFRLNLNGAAADAATPRLTAWGRVAGTTFDGRDGTLALDGDVLTGTVGLDGEWDRLVLGVAVAHSRGTGGYNMSMTTGQARGDLEQTLTSIHPYLRYAVTERLDVWGLVGYGWGDLDLAQATGGTYETDAQLLMGAVGGRGIVLAPADTGGFQLATRTEAMLTRTTSDAVTGLAAGEGDAHRLRVILEGSRAVTWEDGRRLTPTLELGVRHDWGDAETGFGLEVGGRLQYADPALGLTVEGTVRGLVAHADDAYQEWGASGNIRLAPGPAGRGVSLTLAPTWGAAASGVEGLWARQTTQGLAPSTRQAPSGRLAADVGYGLPAPFGRGLVTPYAGTVLAAGAARTYRVGTRLQVPGQGATGLTLTLEGMRQDPGGAQPVNQGVQLQAAWGF